MHFRHQQIFQQAKGKQSTPDICLTASDLLSEFLTRRGHAGEFFPAVHCLDDIVIKGIWSRWMDWAYSVFHLDCCFFVRQPG